jgi:creatinine amidohydrolase/Fe(II)-dependent formamide hydrolase-like protein
MHMHGATSNHCADIKHATTAGVRAPSKLFCIAHCYMHAMHASVWRGSSHDGHACRRSTSLGIAADSLLVQAAVQQHTRRSAQRVACRLRLPLLSCEATPLHVQRQRRSIAGPHVHIQVVNAHVACQLQCCMDQLGCHALPE